MPAENAEVNEKKYDDESGGKILIKQIINSNKIEKY